MAWFLLLLATYAWDHHPAPQRLDLAIVQHGETCRTKLVSEEVATLLASSDVRLEPPWHVDVFVEQVASGFDVRVEVDAGEVAKTARSLHAADCAAAVEAAAFVIAMSVDPALVPEQPAAAPKDPSPRPPASTTRPRVESPAVRPNPSVTGLQGAVTAVAGVDGGALPGASAYVRLELGVLGRHWRTSLGVAHRVHAGVRGIATQAGVGELELWASSLRACGVPRWRALEFPLCGVLEAGVVLGRGRGFAEARSDVAPWAAVALAPGMVWKVHRNLGLLLEVQAGAALTRSRWTVEGLPGHFRTGSLFGRALLGLDVRFP